MQFILRLFPSTPIYHKNGRGRSGSGSSRASGCRSDQHLVPRRKVHSPYPGNRSLGASPPLPVHILPNSSQGTSPVLGLWFFVSLVLVAPLVRAELPEEIQIGGIFDDVSIIHEDSYEEAAFLHAVDRVNDQGILPEGTKLVTHLEQVPYEDSFHAERKICSMLSEGVAAVFGPQSPSTANHVQSVCSNFLLPHIQTTWDFRAAEGDFMVNIYPHPDTLSRAYADLITAWGWDKYIIIYENHESLIRLKEILHESNKWNGRHVRVKQLPETGDDYKPLFKELRNTGGNSAIIIDCVSEKLPKIFQDARESGMVKDRRYFITSLDISLLDPKDFDPSDGMNITALSVVSQDDEKVTSVKLGWGHLVKTGHPEIPDGTDFPSLPNNVLTTQLALMYDGITMLAKSLALLGESQEPDHDRQFGVNSIDCQNADDKWPDGKLLMDAIKSQEFDGLTGHLAIDPETGFRKHLILDVVELTKSGFSQIGVYDSEKTGDDKFEWKRTAEETLRQQEEDIKDKVFIVTTLPGAPYFIKGYGGANDTGYIPDLIEKISELLEFQYEIREAADGKYGAPDNETGQWNGLIGEVMSGAADMAAADLSISFSRQSAIDFTMPFMTLGISILYKTPAKDPPALFSFLEPFNMEVWIYVMTAYLCISLILYMLARISPRDWQEPPPCSPDAGQVLENPFSMANCLWFSTGTIMGQGCDILPFAVCTRTATIAWWFFVLIMISSYTANLAAFLANEGMGSSIKDIRDLPKQTKVKYGCVKGGTTCKFFEKSSFPLYKEIWTGLMSMRPDPFQECTPCGVDRVKKANGNFAFFMESTSIEYYMANDEECRLTQIGGLLDSKGYGIALRKNSQYRNAISNAILILAEQGELEGLKKKWWAGTGSCGDPEPPPGGATALTVANVKGIFVVLVGGVIASTIMSLLEFIWKSRKLAKNVHESFWRAVWQDFKFAVCCQGETKPVRKPKTKDDNGSVASESKSSDGKEQEYLQLKEDNHFRI